MLNASKTFLLRGCDELSIGKKRGSAVVVEGADSQHIFRARHWPRPYLAGDATNVAPELDATFVGEDFDVVTSNYHSVLLARLSAELPVHEADDELPYKVVPASRRRM